MSGRSFEVDQSICVGSMWCVNIAPGAFEIDETGKSRPRVSAAVSEEELLEAEESCPVSAIRVLMESTREVE